MKPRKPRHSRIGDYEPAVVHTADMRWLPMKTIFSVIVLLSGVVAATAQMLGVGGAEITQVGIYERKVMDSNKAAGTSAGRDYNFVSNATTVPARKGVNFGFEYRLAGIPRA